MRYSLTVLIQIAACSLAIAAEGTLDDLKASYQVQLDKITEVHSNAMTALGDQVLTALTKAEEAAKKANDPAAAQIAAEIERWKTEGDLPEDESEVPAVEKIHEIYRAQKELKMADRNRQIAAWFKSYDGRLASLSENDDVKAEREKIGDSSLIKDAVEAAKALPPKPTPGSATKPAPAAPISTGPWQNLKKVKWDSLEGNDYFKGGVEKWNDPITFGGKEYKVRDLIYTHGGGAVTYKFKAPITAFKALGCMEERTGQGNVVFIVETDEGEVFRSKPVTKDHTSEEIDLTFKPSTKLVIKADPNGGAQEDWAFLLEPKYR